MSSIDEERSILGFILKQPQAFNELQRNDALAREVNALDFEYAEHVELFINIELWYLAWKHLGDLCRACEAKALRADFAAAGLEDDAGWGWFEDMGGEEWLFDLMDEATEEPERLLAELIARAESRKVEHGQAA